jgi:hypothetical protein
MKKKWNTKGMIVLMMAMGIMASTACLAQEQQTSMDTALKAKFGIKGGLNLTQLYVANASGEHLKAGFNAGIFVKLPVARGFSIQPELLYSVKGAKEDYNNIVEGSGEYQFNLNYLELPLLAVVNLGPNFNIHAGGYAAYLTGANVKDVNSDGTITGATELNADNFNRRDFGLAGGAGFDIQNFTIGARYNYGLTNIGKSGNLSGNITQNSKNAGFNIYIGFGF